MDITFRNFEGFEYISTNVEGAEVSEDIIITKKAMNMFVNQLSENIIDIIDGNTYFVRFYLVSTSSKAKKYSIKFDNVINEFDRCFELGKLKIVVNRKDLFYFMGMIIDYINNEKEEGFVFLDISDNKVIDYYELNK